MAFIVATYGGKPHDSSDALHHLLYMKTVARQSLQANFDIKTLPPTPSAARKHCLRVYQVQQWWGISMAPSDWGWKLPSGFPSSSYNGTGTRTCRADAFGVLQLDDGCTNRVSIIGKEDEAHEEALVAADSDDFAGPSPAQRAKQK
ncbi:hypothetical protein PR048_022148 [Dryococelus australis]|uniref:Uncharacterized protein n=1 Tax=Dryococelus australis TaxID=614101 RepID=A0ABQ9H079_9NEOP|nr:hypothetical protein PR048_022148 [Dryococelus australis]